MLHRCHVCLGQRGGEQIGPTRRGNGVKIMAIVDRHGLPLAVTTHAANHHEVTLVQLTFDFYMIEAKPENLISVATRRATAINWTSSCASKASR